MKAKGRLPRKSPFIIFIGSMASAAATAAIAVRAKHYKQSNKDDPKALIIEKIANAVHIYSSAHRCTDGGYPFFVYLYIPARRRAAFSALILLYDKEGSL